jgi:hypothetical protein
VGGVSLPPEKIATNILPHLRSHFDSEFSFFLHLPRCWRNFTSSYVCAACPADSLTVTHPGLNLRHSTRNSSFSSFQLYTLFVPDSAFRSASRFVMNLWSAISSQRQIVEFDLNTNQLRVVTHSNDDYRFKTILPSKLIGSGFWISFLGYYLSGLSDDNALLHSRGNFLDWNGTTNCVWFSPEICIGTFQRNALYTSQYDVITSSIRFNRTKNSLEPQKSSWKTCSDLISADFHGLCASTHFSGPVTYNASVSLDCILFVFTDTTIGYLSLQGERCVYSCKLPINECVFVNISYSEYFVSNTRVHRISINNGTVEL